MAKITLSRAEMEERLAEHISAIKEKCKSFDSGSTSMGKDLAVNIAALVFEGRYPSLLTQIGKKPAEFATTSTSLDQTRNLCAISSLVEIEVPPDGKPHFVPSLDSVCARPVPFDEWWNEEVFGFPGARLTRRDLIMTARDQEVAHVDAAVERKYYELSAGKMLDWTIDNEPLLNVAAAAIRQIGHELLLSIDALKQMPRSKTSYLSSILQTGKEIRELAGRAKRGGLLRSPIDVVDDHHYFSAISWRGDFPAPSSPCPCGGGNRFEECHGRRGADIVAMEPGGTQRTISSSEYSQDQIS